jgi:hypothetical protein
MKRMLDATNYDTDKAQHTHYLRNYEEYFEPLRNRDIRLLELGIYRGGSLLLWRDYFDRARIVGLDAQAVSINDPTGRIHTYQGMQHDKRFLDQIARETAPNGFDVIIDDCSHVGELTRISFWHLFDNHLKAGGIYVIEDWATGYWDSWFDGVAFSPARQAAFNPFLFRVRSLLAHGQKRIPLFNSMFRALKKVINRWQFRSHQYGLVGFVKELVDECGMADISHVDKGIPPHRRSKFREMRILPGQIFIIKA